ncbi:unnamed protein product, partial [Ectocarpus fasciculatus]
PIQDQCDRRPRRCGVRGRAAASAWRQTLPCLTSSSRRRSSSSSRRRRSWACSPSWRRRGLRSRTWRSFFPWWTRTTSSASPRVLARTYSRSHRRRSRPRPPPSRCSPAPSACPASRSTWPAWLPSPQVRVRYGRGDLRRT